MSSPQLCHSAKLTEWDFTYPVSCILTCYQAGIRHINEDDAHINQCVLWKVPNYTGAALCPLNLLQSIINMPNGNMFFNFSGPLMSWNLNILQGINRGQQPGKKWQRAQWTTVREYQKVHRNMFRFFLFWIGWTGISFSCPWMTDRNAEVKMLVLVVHHIPFYQR